MVQPFLSKPLSETIGTTLVIAYKESTTQLEKCLNQEGLFCQVLRQVHRPEYKNYAAIYLCFLNHFEAWKIAAQSTRPSLVVEADFVPVLGMGKLPFPLEPERSDAGFAWLYTCAPQIYSVSAQGYAVGFSSAAVAYVLTSSAAQALLDFAQTIIAQADPTQYINWDSFVEEFLRERGFRCYVPFRNYGEHGGKPNPEHKRAGLGTHRADVLFGDLAFRPFYAEGDPHELIWKARLTARLKGLVRLLTGKYLRWKVLLSSNTPWRMLSFAICRHFTLRL
ncbi:MAG: LPS biosynthesis glycosyltransferase [Prochlorotrichaceae cyanobacterium]